MSVGLETGTTNVGVPCPAIVSCERIGGTDEQPLMAVHLYQLAEGHRGGHSNDE